MPTYEYECVECQKTEEVFQKMTDPAPICHEKPMRRLIAGAPGIRKGGGIFSIDFDGVKPGKLPDWKE